jgi:hypothetical protein
MAKPSCSASTGFWISTALQSRKHDDEVRLYGFDCLGFDGDDHAKRMRELITACADLKFEAVRNRVLRDAEIEAAQAGRKN